MGNQLKACNCVIKDKWGSCQKNIVDYKWGSIFEITGSSLLQQMPRQLHQVGIESHPGHQQELSTWQQVPGWMSQAQEAVENHLVDHHEIEQDVSMQLQPVGVQNHLVHH